MAINVRVCWHKCCACNQGELHVHGEHCVHLGRPGHHRPDSQEQTRLHWNEGRTGDIACAGELQQSVWERSWGVASLCRTRQGTGAETWKRVFSRWNLANTSGTVLMHGSVHEKESFKDRKIQQIAAFWFLYSFPIFDFVCSKPQRLKGTFLKVYLG